MMAEELISSLRAEISAAHQLVDKANQRALRAEADRDWARRATSNELAREIERLEAENADLRAKMARAA